MNTDDVREALVDHLNGMMDSLDESVTHDQIYEQLRIAWNMARELRDRGRGPITDDATTAADEAYVIAMQRDPRP
ncbi:hypothetical protein CN976_23010, partial [Bacillus cereus]